VNAAENWGTYVAVHAYTPRAIQAALKGGVKVIEHAQLIDEPTIKMMAQKNAWLSSQAFLDNEYSNPSKVRQGLSKLKYKKVLIMHLS
jgi:imidazolonepropionase-like amidohydrolase